MTEIDRTKFYDSVRADIFRGKLNQVQVEVMDKILDMTGDLTPNVQAYIFATAWHESRMEPVREGFKSTDAQARAYVRRQGYKYAKVVNGHVYYGRGIVQLTHYENYKAWGIENTPDKALEVGFAVKLLVVGMLDGRYNGKGKGLQYYLDRAKPDWKNARRTVNITDRWELIKGYSLKFRKALDLAEQEGTRQPKPIPAPTTPKTTKPAPEPSDNWITTLFKIIFGIFKR